MKITPSDYTTLKQFVEPHMTQARANVYVQAGLSPMRFRWDCLYASKIRIGDGVGTDGDILLYAYCDDTHIDTALRAIQRELGIAYV